MAEITVHHLDASRSMRILWLLEELEQPYTLVAHTRDPKTSRAPAALREVHPLGRAPLVVIDGQVLAESGAILEGLLDRIGAGRLRPGADDPTFADYRFFLHYAEGSVMTPLLVRLLMSRVKAAKLPFFLKPIARTIAGKVEAGFSDPDIAAHFAFIESTLATRPWFAGDRLTAADVQMVFPVAAGLARGVSSEAHPHTAAWWARVQARPAWQRAVARGGAFEIL